MIVLRLTIIFWVRWICFANLTAFTKPAWQGHKCIQLFYQSFGTCIWISLSMLIMFPLPFPPSFSSLLFFQLCQLSFLFAPPIQRRESQTRQLCCFTVSVSCSFSCSVTPFLSRFLSTRYPFWGSDKICLFIISVVVSAAVRKLFSSLTQFHSLCTTFLTEIKGSFVCLFTCSSYDCLFLISVLFSLFFTLSPFSPSLLFFFCAEMKRSLLSAVCCLCSEFFLWFFATCC